MEKETMIKGAMWSAWIAMIIILALTAVGVLYK